MVTLAEVSRCSLNGEVWQLFEPVISCKFLSKIAAAGCNLTGEISRRQKFSWTKGSTYWISSSPLWPSLMAMDLSRNAITSVDILPKSLVSMDFSNMAGELAIGEGILADVIKGKVRANLEMTSIKSREPQQLLENKLLKPTEKRVISGDGYSCHDLADSTLDVSPSKFAPDLLCGCAPGYFGHGVRCRKCPTNSFNPELNQSKCQKCPVNSTTKEGSTSLEECMCLTGQPYNDSGRFVCACREHEALLGEECVSCGKRHLQCKGRGNMAALALPEKSFMRLRPNDTDVLECIENASVRCPGNLTVGCPQGASDCC